MTKTDFELIAQVVHEAIRAYRTSIEEPCLPPWADAAEWMRTSTIEGVRFCLAHPEASPGDQHDQWMHEKITSGWMYGPVKDEQKKTHPMIIPYRDLPEHEKRKDMLFGAVVRALSDQV